MDDPLLVKENQIDNDGIFAEALTGQRLAMEEYKICQIGELKEAVPYRTEIDGHKVALVMIQGKNLRYK